MTTNATLWRGTAAYTTGKFGQALAGGVFNVLDVATFLGASGGPIGTGTIEMWLSTTATTLQVAAGRSSFYWIGVNASGQVLAQPGGTGGQIIGTVINDGLWHHVALVWQAGLPSLYCDGVRVASSATAMVNSSVSNQHDQVGGFDGGSGYDWASKGGGLIDEVRYSSVARYTGTTYTVPTAAFVSDASTVALYHWDGDSTDSSGDIPASTAPGQVTGLTATAGDGQVALSWTAPSNGGSAITDYKVEYQPSGGSWTTFADGTSTATTATVTGLTNGTAYSFRVSAINAIGTGTASATATATPVAAVQATAPAQVTGLTATAGNAQVSLSWTAPSNGGSAITDYVVQYRTTAGPGAWTTFADGTSTATSAVVTGLTNGTGYDFQVAAVNAVGQGTYSATASATPTATPAGTFAPTDSGLLYSPYNWDITADRAFTICAGAYLRALIKGSPTAITLNFDVSNMTATFPTKLKYRIDRGPWTTVNVTATVSIAIPSETAAWTEHFIEVVMKGSTDSVNRWSSPYITAVKFTGLTVAPTSCTLVPIQPAPLNGIVYGDSITEGVNTLSNSGDTTIRSDATLSYAFVLREELGAEVAVVGFGGQGLDHGGSGGVPPFESSWNLQAAGITRTFPVAPDFVVINQGENNGTTDITSYYTTALNGMLSTFPSTTRIYAMEPLSGLQAANIQAAVAACSDPSRVTYVDTTGWWTSSESVDGVHPFGYADVNHIAPRLASAIRAHLTNGGGGTTGSGRYINIGGTAVLVGTVVKG